jgi:hypothetical protein
VGVWNAIFTSWNLDSNLVCFPASSHNLSWSWLLLLHHRETSPHSTLHHLKLTKATVHNRLKPS